MSIKKKSKNPAAQRPNPAPDAGPAPPVEAGSDADDADMRAAILALTGNPAYKPVKPKIMAERLGLQGDAAEALKRVVKRMIRVGELSYGPSHLVLATTPPPAKGKKRQPVAPGANHTAPATDAPAPDGPAADGPAAANAPPAGAEAPAPEGPTPRAPRAKRPRDPDAHTITGVFRRIGSGDGFVRPEGTPASSGKEADVFVGQRNAADAASGDRVRIVLSKHTGFKGKPEGKVVDVVERATNQFVGAYFERAGMGLVQVDGKVFSAPVYVGDPGAKGAQTDDKVVIEMVRFPSHLRDGEGVITRILGPRGAPGVDTLSVVHEFGLPGEFSEEVLADARAQADRFDESVTGDRRDLTGETVVTIDPVTARDFDDAISLERLEGGHWLLGVHIADVSHFVQPKTALDAEAYDRATSVYLPDQVIPMLPEVISNNLASLQPGRVRYAMTARIEFTPKGVPVASEVFRSAIKSCRRFTYEEVDAYLTEKGLVAARRVVAPPAEFAPPRPPAAPPTGVAATLTPQVDRLLGDMFELAMTLRKRRFERGALELNMPEMAIDLDPDGRVAGAHLEQNTESHQVIEEFMLAANEAVARTLAEAGLIFLRRVHGAPDPRKMRLLTDFARDLGFKVDNLEDRFELQALLTAIHGDPREHAVNFAALRSMQRAVYSPEDQGHYALASDCYCHFTSPIRRYPDLTVHRLINALNAGKKPAQDLPTYFRWGDHCSDREQRAASAERELNKVKLLNYLADKIGLQLEGIITGVESFGLFVMGKDLPAEGFIPIAALGDDYYKFDRATHSVSGFRSGNAYRLGDTVRVAVASVAVDTRELNFRLLGRAKGGKAPAPQKGGPRGKGGGGAARHGGPRPGGAAKRDGGPPRPGKPGGGGKRRGKR